MPASPGIAPPSSPSNNTMRAHCFISRQQISIIPCKKYHKVITRASMSKLYQTHCVCKHFNIKTSKTQWFFNKKLSKSPPARSCGFVLNPPLFKHFCEKGFCEQLFHAFRTSATTVAHVSGPSSLAKNNTKCTCARPPRAHIEILPNTV